MYTLYHNKRERIIEVKRATKGMSNCTYTDEVERYNDCYYTCSKRSPLVEKAKEIKQSWVEEIEKELEKVNAIQFLGWKGVDMSRLTKRDEEKGYAYSGYSLTDIVNKLADYEDAEEQGLLVKVECHCKDCKYVDFAGCKNKTCYCLEHECYMQEDDFCKYAERYKEEAEQMKGVR